jgi:histidinol phosphatase-like enzyme
VPRGKPVIAVDFDGTLFHTDELGELSVVAGAREALADLRARGYRIVIHTCRTGLAAQDGELSQEVAFIESNLRAHGLVFDEIHLGEKMVADVYIDDRGVTFDGDWTSAVNATLRILGE